VERARELILPVATLVLVIVPYLYRMMRAATVEALESEYVEMARLKDSQSDGWCSFTRCQCHCPDDPVIGLNFLYLAGGS